MKELTTIERTRLTHCETVIEAHVDSFISVGNALLTISDERLYRETHSTFNEYVMEKWAMTARRAYQLCEAAEVIKELAGPNVNHGTQTGDAKSLPMVDKVTNERQARALSKAPKGTRALVLQAVASTGPVTAKSIEAEIIAQAPPSLESKMAEQFKGLEIPPVEPPVTQFYCLLEAFIADAFERATVKQLNSMGVYAAMIPKLIKQEIARRSGK